MDGRKFANVWQLDSCSMPWFAGLYRVRVFFFSSIATNMKEAKPGSVMFKNYLIFVGTRILRRLHFFCTVRHGGV